MHFSDDRTAAGASWWKCEINRNSGAIAENSGKGAHGLLLRANPFRTSAAVTSPLLDPRRLAAKAARAARIGGDQFLLQRAFEDCVDRVSMIRASPQRAVIVSERQAAWAAALNRFAQRIDCLPLESLEPECADLVVAVGVLDRSSDPAIASFVLRHALRPGGRLIGATIGDRSLVRSRRAFLDAERATGRAARRFHPLPDPAALSALLTGAGLADVVIDVDVFNARYGGLAALVRDLRAMGCTNSLANSIRPLQPAVYRHACELFSAGQEKVEESFEILHFSGVAKNAV